MIILLAGTPIGEFVKLPMLVYHMVSHFQEDPKMSLAEFLICITTGFGHG